MAAAAAAAGSLASSGPKRVMRGRFERRRMTIYYRWIANGSQRVYDNRCWTSSPIAPSVRWLKYDRRRPKRSGRTGYLAAPRLRNDRASCGGLFCCLVLAVWGTRLNCMCQRIKLVHVQMDADTSVCVAAPQIDIRSTEPSQPEPLMLCQDQDFSCSMKCFNVLMSLAD